MCDAPIKHRVNCFSIVNVWKMNLLTFNSSEAVISFNPIKNSCWKFSVLKWKLTIAYLGIFLLRKTQWGKSGTTEATFENRQSKLEMINKFKKVIPKTKIEHRQLLTSNLDKLINILMQKIKLTKISTKYSTIEIENQFGCVKTFWKSGCDILSKNIECIESHEHFSSVSE